MPTKPAKRDERGVSERRGFGDSARVLTRRQGLGLGSRRGSSLLPRQAPRALGKTRALALTWKNNPELERVPAGGTELAPMSTTTDVGVAVGYAVRNGQTSRSLLFRIVTDNNLQRGADLRWLSMFPGEAETLYPPLTFMQPTRRTQTVKVDGFELEVVEVKATIS